MTRKVLIPVDPSNESEKAFDWAFDNVIRENDKVIILHVYPAGIPGYSGLMAATGHVDLEFVTKVEREAQAAAEALAVKYVKRAHKKGYEAEYIVTSGSSKDVICDTVQERNVNLVVMGSRGLGKIKKALLGSVSDFVVRHAECPVIVYRKKH
eukprot:TRINITY_DN23681_c0_g1_i1.p2 TRINITY_DN23681_c0_g1~~TRINITY_DN23681_c0_g1_i1.p2  ORF type:complete len:153 (-),score=55.66 TRINITY_DN23681_c0_g1_i1:317-775(-)